jgi:hypothetical protein
MDFTGILTITTPGVYIFTMTSDDGSRLWMDGPSPYWYDKSNLSNNLLIDIWGFHASSTVTGTITLTAGDHRVFGMMF